MVDPKTLLRVTSTSVFFKVLKLPTNFTSKNFRRPSGGDFFHKSINFNEFCDLCPPQAENFAVFRACLWFSDLLRANPDENLPTNFGDYSRSNLIYPQIFKNLSVITVKKNTAGVVCCTHAAGHGTFADKVFIRKLWGNFKLAMASRAQNPNVFISAQVPRSFSHGEQIFLEELSDLSSK